MKVTLITIAAIFIVGLWVAAIKIANRPLIYRVQSKSEHVDKQSPSGNAKAAPTPLSRAEAKRLVTVDFTWSKGGFDAVMLVNFTFKNPTPYEARDITVTCIHSAPSGTEIDRNTRTVYEVVPAKGKKVVREFNMGFIHSQATSTRCSIDDLEM